MTARDEISCTPDSDGVPFHLDAWSFPPWPPWPLAGRAGMGGQMAGARSRQEQPPDHRPDVREGTPTRRRPTPRRGRMHGKALTDDSCSSYPA